jgi:hypothetical protein
MGELPEVAIAQFNSEHQIFTSTYLHTPAVLQMSMVVGMEGSKGATKLGWAIAVEERANEA